MYGRLVSTRKRALARRQIEILNRLLDKDEAVDHMDLFHEVERHYMGLSAPLKAYIRDLNQLSALRAILVKLEEIRRQRKFLILVRPEWATEITETEFYREMDELPAAKTRLYVSGD
jgi:hypothetical protein